MSPLLSICYALLLGLAISGFTFSSADCYKILHTGRRPFEDFCPLNFYFLRKLIAQGAPEPTFPNMPTKCHYILQGIRLVRSEYLRTDSSFLLPPNVSKACWQSYRSLVGEFFDGFDIQTACGYHPEWISRGCMNITSQAEFESLIPVPKLQEIERYCNQSLVSSSACEMCSKILSSLGDSYLHGPDNGNVSDCTGYPFMYAAAVVNELGPTDKTTAKCLFSFSLELPLMQPSNIKRHILVLFGVLAGCLLGFFGASSAVLFLWMRRKKSEREKKNISKDETGIIMGLGSINGSTSFVKFEYEDVKKATMNFYRENLIGKGGYGNVYKGILPDGSQVAFKRFKNCSAAGVATFAHEVEVIASVRHVNLVSLRGYCTKMVPLEGHQRIIVCDFMPNGSLYDHLFGSEMKIKLSWPIRQKIALGTARGLAYLHYGAQPAIIHRDIKASNILLDKMFEPKLADFGLARYNAEGTTHLNTRVAGTLGYVAPEYALYGMLTERSDVYSFGVVLLELLSGKKALETEEAGKTSLLTDWAWSLMQKGRAGDVIEEGMPECGSRQLMEQHVVVAVLCCHPILHARPTMDHVVKMLETDPSNSSVCHLF
ncbi:probable LRR receptor-like serine/threonine-protein kinase RKF3 [Juglans microcarpa x Juglans regia]|uniref:probable LRR receptor-like serine/threonine-protein kinase RKF3 n=1 Tax=Juglans microcarpa x Juglans regia TaxID=2249226 RepID=UPI001B7ED3F3|nr:probable LRR receptor-like serine/threonine-protein kinase RKF3 [Juglans microcarpa x Juglans regia]